MQSLLSSSDAHALTSLTLCLFFNFACHCLILHIFRQVACMLFLYTPPLPLPPPRRVVVERSGPPRATWGGMLACCGFAINTIHPRLTVSLDIVSRLEYIYNFSCLLNCVPLGVEASICPHRVSVLNAHSPMNTALTITFFIF